MSKVEKWADRFVVSFTMTTLISIYLVFLQALSIIQCRTIWIMLPTVIFMAIYIGGIAIAGIALMVLVIHDALKNKKEKRKK